RSAVSLAIHTPIVITSELSECGKTSEAQFL
ncbi:hypothetical protein HMPREF2086_00607, partial [Helicobacter macacae MIT 99-5501]